MAAVACMGRLGPLAGALGVGVALMVGGVATAAAETGDGMTTPVQVHTRGTPHRSAPSRPSPIARRSAHTAPRTGHRTAAASGAFGGLSVLLNNEAPTLAPAQTGQNSAGVVTGRLNADDSDSAELTYSITATPAHGAVAVDDDGGYRYTPDPVYASTGIIDSFSVAVSDAGSGFHIHGLTGLLNLLTFGLLGSAGHTTVRSVNVAAAPFTTSPGPSTGGGDPSPDPAATLAAFPGAEGFGASATGGRGGSVIYVTNLSADGPGSLQWAIDQPGARYILFKVSGLIDAQIHLTNGNVTIAGQTSPGGITIRGLVTDETPFQDQAVQAPTDFAENWILQHIRIRPGLGGPSDDGLRIRYTRNAILDHVSIGNATDEAIEISYSHDITVQNTIIAETVGGHSFYGGVLMNYSNPAYGFELNDISLHHDIFNRIEGRLPEGSRESQAAANSTLNLELSNNLYWDPNFFIALANSTGVATGPAGEPYPIYWKINAVNNYFRTRTDFPYGMFDDQILRNPVNQLYVSGNRMSLYPSLSDYQLFYCCNDFSAAGANTGAQVAQKLPARNPFPEITYTPTDRLQTALLNAAGAWPRDPMDNRLLGSVASNTIATAPRNTNPAGDALRPAYAGAPPAAPADADGDGMPDSWEIGKGLDPNVANTNATDLSTVGYTDLDVYLHELSQSRITGWSA